MRYTFENLRKLAISLLRVGSFEDRHRAVLRSIPARLPCMNFRKQT